jgi:hypothetical protein
MATNDYVLESLAQLDRYVRLMGAMPTIEGIVDVVKIYLAEWPRKRVLSLQAMDAGWAPFDDNQQAQPIEDADDVRRIFASVRSQCAALRAAGLTLTPELLELDLFFFFANESMAVHEPDYGVARPLARPKREMAAWQ